MITSRPLTNKWSLWKSPWTCARAHMKSFTVLIYPNQAKNHEYGNHSVTYMARSLMSPKCLICALPRLPKFQQVKQVQKI